MIQVVAGDPIPLFVIMEDGAADYVVKADIVNPYTGVKLHSDLALTYVASSAGYYRHTDQILMSSVGNLLIVYRVYESDGTTLFGTDSEEVVLKTDSVLEPSAAGTEVLVAVIDDDPIIATVGEAT